MSQRKADTEPVKLTLPSQSVAYLKDLARIGTHGPSATEVAKSFVMAGIRAAIERGYIKAKTPRRPRASR